MDVRRDLVGGTDEARGTATESAVELSPVEERDTSVVCTTP